jgi:hypothetical protein
VRSEADEVHDAAHAYEAALVSGDTAAAAAWFEDGTEVSRFGPEGAQFGAAEVRALRAATAPVAAPTWVHDDVRLLAPGVATHLAVLHRGGAVIQRTQIWRHGDGGWRIAHAHVSRPAVQP